MKYADLHIHTTASDGTFTPEQVVEKAANAGLDIIAITDHDTIAAVRQAAEAGKELGLTVIPGIEISTDYLGLEIHLLGYGIDEASPALEPVLKWSVEEKNIRNSRMVQGLRAAGFDISLDDIIPPREDTVIGRPHIAALMVEKGYALSVLDVFDKYIGDGKPFYVPRQRMKLEDAVSFVKKAGGVPVLAHPLQYEFSFEQLKEFIVFGAKAGVMGIEVIYTGYSLEQMEMLTALAAENGLFITGGSDFHGDCMPGIALGSAKVPEDVIEPLLTAANIS